VGIAQLVAHAAGESILCVRGGDAAVPKLLCDFVLRWQHDPDTAECSPGGQEGNYIMYARATSGDRPNNNKFSSCSKKSMSAVLQFKARTHDGCFVCESHTPTCHHFVIE